MHNQHSAARDAYITHGCAFHWRSPYTCVMIWQNSGICFTSGYETLGRISVSYSKPTTQPRRHMEHVYSEIGPPVLPPRGYGDDYMVETDTPADEHDDSVNASPKSTLWENRKTWYTGFTPHLLSNRFNIKFKFYLISLLLSAISIEILTAVNMTATYLLLVTRETNVYHLCGNEANTKCFHYQYIWYYPFPLI